MKPITKKQKRNEKILVEYEKLIAEGWPKMDAYKHIGEKHNLKEGGVRFAIQAAYVLRAKQVTTEQNMYQYEKQNHGRHGRSSQSLHEVKG